MRIVKTIIIPAIVALSAAGSVLAASAAPVAAAEVPPSHVLAAAPHTYMRG